jgi:phosphoenolpyruvate---glycerone phosphotransferase subunit DhaL
VTAQTLEQVVSVLDVALTALAEQRGVLRDLDAAVGDGDLGITVDKGSAAVRAALAEQPPGTVGELLRTSGAAFAKANPSTMAALVGAGLLAAAKTAGEEQSWTPQLAEKVGRAAMARIAERGKAELGDKTVLDALAPSLDALSRAADGQALAEMIAAARSGVDATTTRAGRRGRAAWVGERGSGHPDPGATAYVFLLMCVSDAQAAAPPR